MKNKFLKTYFPTEEDLNLLQSTHILAEASVWKKIGLDKTIATFDVFVRNFKKRNFMLFSGLEEVLHYLKNLHFSEKNIKFFLKNKLILKETAHYFKNIKFTGTVYSLPEGTPFFPGEPIIRISAPLPEAALVERGLINIVCSNVPFLTKAMRCTIAAKNKVELSTGPVRGHSLESCFKACRAGYLAGLSVRVILSVPQKYHIKNTAKPFRNATHLFIKSFPSELEAMRAITNFFPNNCSVMVDTYDMKLGISNAIKVAKELEKKGRRLAGIQVDSGNLLKYCNYARKELDKNGLSYVKIATATNLDEYKIEKLIKKNIQCNMMAVITELLTLSDSPTTEVIYKLAETRKNGKITYTAKLTPGKLSLPGRKQIFRIYDKKGRMVKDIIGLENEKLGKSMLKKVMKNGKITYKLPTLEEIREYTKKTVATLPKRLLDINKDQRYAVEISPKIKNILKDLRKKHLGKIKD